MLKNILVIFILLLCPALAQAKGADSKYFGQKDPHHIEVNNRILAKVNGKGISVIDVMKKMDMVFYKQFPEYAGISEARLQFYNMHWKDVLKQLIDKELVLADVDEAKMPISNGDVRQEMETLFGPDMIENLDQAGLTFEEAFKMVQGDIAIKRMMFAKVNAKAIRGVTPQAIHEAYEEYAKKNLRSHEWIYYVISVRDPEEKDGEETANTIYRLLADQKVPLNDFRNKFAETGVGKHSAINMSEELRHKDLEVSEAFKEILFKLEPGTYSKPIAQKSRRDHSTVWRIFFLKQIIQGGMVPFNEVEDQLRENLIDAAIDKETDAYFAKLRERFSVEELDLNTAGPNSLQPFVLK